MFFSVHRSKSAVSRLLSLFTVAILLLQQLVLTATVATATTTGAGAISLSANGIAYTQDFDTLANSGTSSAVPSGWYFDETGANANTTYTAGTGSSNSGDTYSFGASGSTERAFGTLLSGSLTPIIGAKFTNNTGLTITSLDVSYTGEQWRLGTSNRTTAPMVDKLLFQLSTDATSLTTGTYTSVGSLDFSSPVTTGTVGALNGNSAANRTNVSATISNLSIANGASFFIRWTDLDASSADDGLAIDDFSITPHGNFSSTNPTGTGTASPSSVKPGDTTLLTVNVSPGTNPTSTNLKVTGDLTAIGGSSSQQFADNGSNTFTFNATVAINTTTGTKSLPITITDAQARTGSTSIALIINSSGATRDPAEHMVMGNPSGATADVNNENNYLMMKPEYALSYNRSRAIPNWTSWHLDNSWLGSQTRTDTFRADTTLPSGWYQVNENSYSGSGFNRGHMTPSGDRTFSFDENAATFLMTNMIPQAPDNNSGTWEGLESYARQLVAQGNELYIISGGYGQGGIGSNGAATTVDQGRVVVPAKTWKVILVLPDSGGDDVARVNTQTRTIAVIIPNEQGVNPDWHNYIVSVDEVEALTGYNFFSNVPENIQSVIEANADGNTIAFSAATYSFAENAQHAVITVNRTGNLSQAASVEYSSSDTAGLAPCSDANGLASERCDYATVAGTLNFAAGESSKIIFIPLVDDGYVEGSERFTIKLSNASGASLVTNSTATVTITDNDNSTSNPIVGVPFFVRQQYIDFLGREPDAAGFAGWQNILNSCAPNDTSCDRIAVSAGFFRSPEFQDRGYFIFRFYSAALGRNPLYSEFMPDLAKVSGFLSAAQLEANKTAFVQEFMARPEYVNRYGSLTSNTAYVDALLQTGGLPNHPLRQPWIDVLDNGTATRAQVLRAFTESVETYNKFYNQAFVVMQYFGYLRRDPDAAYTQWIQTMNSNGGDYRTMINGFMNSTEYVLRFGP